MVWLVFTTRRRSHQSAAARYRSNEQYGKEVGKGDNSEPKRISSSPKSAINGDSLHPHPMEAPLPAEWRRNLRSSAGAQ
jgi:hypothetical protein